MSRRVLRPVLGDQLTFELASLRDAGPDDLVLIAEVGEEAGYVGHHKKKIAFLFSAMRHFAAALEANGVAVRYVRLDDPDNTHSLKGEAVRALEEVGPFDAVALTEPGEWRVLKDFQAWSDDLGVPVTIAGDDRFICAIDEFARWADGKKQLRMEFFYREMRKKTGVLMEGDDPVGGQWNLDHDNRKALPSDFAPPKRLRFEPDDVTREVLGLVGARFDNHFGDLEPFEWGVTHADAEAALDHFITDCLPQFGDYQDAMADDEPFLMHGLVSLYLNAGLLDPLETCRRVEDAYSDGHAPLNAVEGFIRQILGWREYVRGIYWLHMPDYKNLNALEADRPLPDFYWTGETKMNCLRQAVLATKQHAYAHHIQRLMITGNFALLAGVHPDAINDWYLAVYADAYEWVELPNTHGMAIYADGGIMASKPYAAGGAYINKMSNHCKACSYKVTKKNGPDACPFNYLYWDFMARNEERLRSNQRIGKMYGTYHRFSDEKKQAIREDSRRFLESIGLGETLEAAQ